MRGAAALLLLSLALAGCTGPAADPDGDGVDSTVEQEPRELKVQARNGTQSRPVTSDPALRDTDGDGLDDGQEFELLTDPRDVDTDDDGLLDGGDLRPAPGSAMEQQLLARGILRAADGRFLGEQNLGTRPFAWDSDRPFPDGLGDGDEVRGWDVTIRGQAPRAVASDPASPDTDGDGLNDFEERRRGCDPRLADSDADGVGDAADADCAHDIGLRVEVRNLTLARDLDASGPTDLHVEAQAAGQVQSHHRAVRAGPNEVGFVWDVEVPDGGPWMAVQVQVVLAFWDRDEAGDDPQSGVSRQPVCVAGAASPCNVLRLEVDLFQGRWSSDRGQRGLGEGRSEGPDGRVGFRVAPLLR